MQLIFPLDEPHVWNGTGVWTEVRFRDRHRGSNRPQPAGCLRRWAVGLRCVCDLTGPLGLTQVTISHHLKILAGAGIFTRDKRGVRAYYALVAGALTALAAVLSTKGQDPKAGVPGQLTPGPPGRW